MIDPQELVTLLMAAIILGVGWSSRLRRDERVAYRLLVGAFLLLMAGWTATLAEEVVYHTMLNMIEHVARMLAALLVAAACWSLRERAGRKNR